MVMAGAWAAETAAGQAQISSASRSVSCVRRSNAAVMAWPSAPFLLPRMKSGLLGLHGRHPSHRDTVGARPTSRPRHPAEARGSVTVSGGDCPGERAPSRRSGASSVRNYGLGKPLRKVVLGRAGRCGPLPRPEIWPVTRCCCRTAWMWSSVRELRVMGRVSGLGGGASLRGGDAGQAAVVLL